MSTGIKIKASPFDIIFDSMNTLFMILFCITTIFPFIYLLSLSLSPADTSFARIIWIPGRIVLTNYEKVFSSELILSGFANTFIRVSLGTFLQIIAIICTAYPLSKKYFPHRNFWTGFVIFTMFFSGGLIPSYLLVKDLGLRNSMWALILPILVPTFTMIIVRNFFMTIHPSLEESARIDGANDIIILFRIIVPLSMPIIATAVLWQAVGHWNAWFDSMIYIEDPKKQMLQVVLRMILLQGSNDDILNMGGGSINDMVPVNPECVKAATIIATALPIIITYPFLQKYFVQGIMIGSLKG